MLGPEKSAPDDFVRKLPLQLHEHPVEEAKHEHELGALKGLLPHSAMTDTLIGCRENLMSLDGTLVLAFHRRGWKTRKMLTSKGSNLLMEVK